MPKWYRQSELKAIVLWYYCVVRQVIKRNPQLKKCLTRCKDCHIFFITDPRNKGRKDLRCPFGCRQHHRKTSMRERSASYYQTINGKDVKANQNQRRNRQKSSELSALTEPTKKELIPASQMPNFDEIIIDYLKNVLRLIEGCILKKSEILRFLKKKWRRHSMDYKENSVYNFKYY